MTNTLTALLSPYAQAVLTPEHKVYEPVLKAAPFSDVTRTAYVIATACPNEHWQEATDCQAAAGMCQLSVECTPKGHRINIGWL